MAFYLHDPARRGLRALLTAMVIAPVLAIGGPSSGGEVAPAPAGSPEVTEGAALARAAASGRRVEVTASRTETDTTYANPDGTLTTDISAVPVRVRRGADWVPVDLDLRPVDGVVVPGASTTGTVFSAGGDNKLVTLTENGETFGLDWPGVLPEPTLHGATAEYAGVLPGVDLLMTATAAGYRQVLRVNDRRAAKSPALRRLRFAIRQSAGSTITRDHGGFDVVGNTGDVVFQADAPTMWDSAGAHGRAAAPATSNDRSESAREGAKIRTMDLEVGDGWLDIVPDAAMLTAADTVYPVFIDPETEAPGRTEWTMVQKEYPNTEFYKWPNDTGYGWGEGVGFQNASGVSTKRLIWEFNTTGIPDAAEVLTASLRVDETHSWSCTKANVNLDRVGRIGSGTNWSNQPSKLNTDGPLATSNVQVRINAGTGDCMDKVTPITFGLDSGDTLARAVKSSLDEDAIALRLSATESSATGWKRFENDAVLSVKHNRAPNTPATPTLTDVETGRGCGDWVPSRTAFPTMTTRISDPDGDVVDAFFDVDRVDGGTWVNVGETAVANLASGSIFDRTLPSSWAQKNGAWFDGHYRFRTYGQDTVPAKGDPSPYCGFYLDSWDPVIHQVTATTQKGTDPEVPADLEEWLTRDQILKFVFDGRDSNNINVSDVVKYVVTSDVPALHNKTIAVTTGADGTLAIPTNDVMGEHWVTVKAYDRAGRVSAAYTRNFRVQGAVETSRFEFDEGTGTTLAGTGDVTPPSFTRSSTGSSFGVLKPGEPENGVPAKYFLSFDGTGNATAAAALAKTNAAFSVSAWVRASEVSTRRVIASQHTSTGQVYALGIRPCTGGTCAFFTTGTYTVESQPLIQAGRWYVIAGSFDDMSAQRRLKVWVSDENATNSAVNATLPATYAPPLATGTRLADELVNGVAQSGWVGDIEDVRFYSDEVAPVDVNIHMLSDNPNQPL